MTKILLLLIFICSVTSVFAQPGKTRKNPPKPKPPVKIRQPVIFPPPVILPPPPRLELCPKPAKLTDEEAIERIVNPIPCPNSEETSDKTFLWKFKINKDMTLPPETVYQQYVELRRFSVTIVTDFTNHPTEVKKDSDIEKKTMSGTSKFDDFSVKVEKNILILTNKKSKEIEKFRVFLDEKKENILRIQNLKTNYVYEPSESYPRPPMIALPKK